MESVEHQISAETAERAFEERFGRTCEGVSIGPGRVNIIGEHTDYNAGLALPAAVDLATYVAYAPRAGAHVRVYSETTRCEAVFELVEEAGGDLEFWARYAWGVGMALLEEGLPARALDMYVTTSVPLGGGLSSSASFEVALALAYMGDEAARSIDRLRLATLCRRAENHFVGVNCGIMDQYASVFGIEGKALLLDCRSLESRPVSFPAAAALVVADTRVRHALGEGTDGYHKRQDECREAVGILAGLGERVESLRDVDPAMLEARRARLGDVMHRRARHVVTENDRVIAAAEAMESGDLERLGELLSESHRSLAEDFEVSCMELDAMVEAARGIAGGHGSRMVGGGFGGCTISLVEKGEVKAFAGELRRRYREATGLEAATYVVRPGRGARLAGG